MKFEFDYNPMKLTAAVANAKKAYPSLWEIAEQDLYQETEMLISRLKELSREPLYRFARYMNIRELEILVYSFSVIKAPELLTKMEYILQKKYSEKLYRFGWILFQHNYGNAGSFYVLKQLARLRLLELKKGGAANSEDAVAELFQPGNVMMEDILEKVGELLCTEGMNVKRFFLKFYIDAKSTMGTMLVGRYLLFCGHEDFVLNREVLLEYMNSCKGAANTFAAYLDKFEITEYFPEVMYNILAECGMPEDNGEFWGSLDPDYREKVTAWLDYKRVENHFGAGTKEFRFWSEYYRLVRKVTILESCSLLTLDFGEFALVDIKDGSGFSYIYDNEAFQIAAQQFEQPQCEPQCVQQQYESQCVQQHVEKALEEQQCEQQQNEHQKEWEINKENLVDLRDFYIFGTKAHIYRCSYDKANLLYLKEWMKQLTTASMVQTSELFS